MTAARVLALGFGVLLATVGRADDKKAATGFVDRIHKTSDGKEIKYVVFVPHAALEADKTHPVILFLHGAGETKTNTPRPGQTPKMPVEVGIGPAIKKQEETFPFLTIIPQAQTFGWQAEGANAKMALAMLDEAIGEFKGDPKRTYLTGLSMGGMGTWSLAVAYPERWAAVAPICGGLRGANHAEAAAKMKNLPCWCFHGSADTAVPPSMSRDLIKALWAAGATPNYTEYPGVGHNSWDKAYATADLYEWFLKHKAK